MPDYLEPSVYVEEIGFRPKRIEPAPTAVTALLGTALRGPTNEPVAVQSVAGFDRVYGDRRGCSLRRAIGDFFDNGGRSALAVRVTDGSAALAALAEHDWQLLVAHPAVDLAEAHALCLRQHAFLICDATSDGDLPAGLGRNAAAYFPPLADRDGSRACSPAVAGVVARTDAEGGVWRQPAGLRATVSGTLSTEVTRGEVEDLGHKRINALRDYPGIGAVVWGARTASDDPEWRYVSVRRLVLFVERSIERGLQWAIFEPNDEPLWARVLLAVEDFLGGLWRQGALVGTKPSESYFVRCDRSTMTQADLDAGRLVVLLGLAPIKPAEFIILRLDFKVGAPG